DNTSDTAGGGTVTVAHATTGDPAFVNPEQGDYHILATSAALDAGVDSGVATDIDGHSRPQYDGYDLGADELSPIYLYYPVVLRYHLDG
ncbi:MAG: choice-of-anchor Q domain-containing protein, partial [Chloroflexota bacterium]|nr:choice-of-anchor Q domain-containing protein [Chloroflexota bacterium]